MSNVGFGRIIWKDKEFLQAARAAVETASEKGADLVLRSAQRKVPVDTGRLKRSLGKRKSKFRDGGWIVGVFDSTPGGRWRDTMGARAVFVEYGHAGPGMGKGRRGSSGLGRIWKAGSKVAEGKPFLKPALKRNKARINQIFQDEMGE